MSEVSRNIAHDVVEKLKALEPVHPEIGLMVNFAVDTCIERDLYKKAFELACDELAINKHCKRHPNCYISEDEEDCQLIYECHNSEWLKAYYLEKAGEESEANND